MTLPANADLLVLCESMKNFFTRLLSISVFCVAPHVLAQTPVNLPKIDPAAYLPARKPGPTIRVSLQNVSITGGTAAAALQRLRAIHQTACPYQKLR
jgi:hypothetical protein